jgi:hypothetical protein
MLISGGIVSSHGCPSSSRYERAARVKIVRTTSRLRLMVVAVTPDATRSAIKDCSVASWI